MVHSAPPATLGICSDSSQSLSIRCIQAFVLYDGFTFPHGLPLAPADIGADALTFRLGEGAQHGDEDLAVRLHGVDVFLFEDDCDTQFPESPDIVQAVYRISGKAGDGLGQDDIDFLTLALADHLQKFRALSGRSSCDALIGKNACHRPVLIAHDFVGIVGLLGFVAGELFLVICRYPAVSGDSQLPLDSLLCCAFHFRRDRNDSGWIVSHCGSLL